MSRKRIPVSFDNIEQSKRKLIAPIRFMLPCSLNDKRSAEKPKTKYNGSFNPEIYETASTLIGWTKNTSERKRESTFIFGSRTSVPLGGDPYFLRYFIFSLPERLCHSFPFSSAFAFASILPKRAFKIRYKILALSICKATWNRWKKKVCSPKRE